MTKLELNKSIEYIEAMMEANEYEDTTNDSIKEYIAALNHDLQVATDEGEIVDICQNLIHAAFVLKARHNRQC